MPDVDVCQSCGMPMETLELHGGGIKGNPYCVYCTDAHGHLKPRNQVREGMIRFFMDSMAKSREDAEKVVDATMSELPAWKEH